MTDPSKIEALHKQWVDAYAKRTAAIETEGAVVAFFAARAKGEDAHAAENAYYAEHIDPHTDAQFAAERAIFALPAASLREFSIKVLIAFTDNPEPDELRRNSLIADATRFTK